MKLNFDQILENLDKLEFLVNSEILSTEYLRKNIFFTNLNEEKSGSKRENKKDNIFKDFDSIILDKNKLDSSGSSFLNRSIHEDKENSLDDIDSNINFLYNQSPKYHQSNPKNFLTHDVYSH